MEKITIENLSFTYPGKQSPAISGISLTINRGEFVTICGKSGCGKSTLLRHLKPALVPSGERLGCVRLDGVDIKSNEEAKVGFVFQNPDNGIVCDSVCSELAFGLENLAVGNARIRIRVAEAASFFGIQNWYNKDVSILSGGQKQLLALASLMVMQPEVLILDEPTGQLDPIAAQEFLSAVSKINRELGVTVILSEHRLEEAVPLSDRIIVMEEGRILCDEPPERVGQVLKALGSDMLLAMPTPVRVYCAAGGKDECPVRIKEGREWLFGMPCTAVDYNEEQKNCNNTVISANDVWFRYEKKEPDILKGFSFSVKQGEMYAIVGGNGAGKSTAFLNISGILKPYRGKIKTVGKIGMLPQNPEDLFLETSVKKELMSVCTDIEMIQALADFCGLSNILESHPYDLSGGEKQRTALAKVLLSKPEILLLDEPTKGLDAHFKEKLATILGGLLMNGMTVVMVSHDIEFCAKYAHRIGMLFDGHILSEEKPRSFFAENSFYTTSASRMARGIIQGAVLTEDIIDALGGEEESKTEKLPEINYTEKKEQAFEKKGKVNVLFGIVFAVLWILVQYVNKNDFSIRSYIGQAVGIILLGASIYSFIPKKTISITQKSSGVSCRSVAAAVSLLLLVPITIYLGTAYFGERGYYLISLLIILEILLPFFIAFDGKNPSAKELALISVLTAIGVIGRIAFSALPQFKPVAAIVIICGLCLGSETGFLIGALTAFVSNFYFTQGVWTPWQMVAFGTIGFFAGVIMRRRFFVKNRITLALFGFFATIILYGGIMNPAYIIMYQEKITLEMILLSYGTGFPSDLVHGISTAFFLWFSGGAMCEKIERIKTKYEV